MITSIANITTANDLSLGDLKNLTDWSFAKPVSSYYDGLFLVDIDFQIRQVLWRYIVASKKPIVPCLPNFFLEVASTNLYFAKPRSRYSGTLGARGVYKLCLYVNPNTALDNRVYTVVAIYQMSGILQLYTIYPAPFGNDDLGYYMILLCMFPMTDNLESVQRRVRALRNARDDAIK